jgi:flagellar biosynthesis/type III secretory pathway protein FliH
MAQYRYQQQYLQREEQIRIREANSYNSNHNSFFYAAPNYRYLRGGAYYETNQYGANLLRQAVNYGYEQGFRSGQADRQDRWKSNYQDSFAYQDANYGYSGYYVDQSEYNYYFREGFRRGYEDGFSGRYQYGRYSNGTYSVLGSVLSLVLNLESLR